MAEVTKLPSADAVALISVAVGKILSNVFLEIEYITVNSITQLEEPGMSIG